MARRMCSICNKRAVATGVHSGYEDRDFCAQQGYCYPCGDEGQHEIAHDNGHDGIGEDDCWLCHPEKNEASRDHTARKGHTNTVAKSRGSHAYCTHERTPQGRARCRAARVTLGPAVWTDHAYNARCTCKPTRDSKILIHAKDCPIEPRHAS